MLLAAALPPAFPRISASLLPFPQTYLRRNYADEMSLLPTATRADPEMVLRYAFDRGGPARASEGELVTMTHLKLFLGRFGPMRSCLLKAARYALCFCRRGGAIETGPCRLHGFYGSSVHINIWP